MPESEPEMIDFAGGAREPYNCSIMCSHAAPPASPREPGDRRRPDELQPPAEAPRALSADLLERLERLGVRLGPEGLPAPPSGRGSDGRGSDGRGSDGRDAAAARSGTAERPHGLDERPPPGELGSRSGGGPGRGAGLGPSPGWRLGIESASPARMELAEAVPGREADNAHGRCWVAEVRRDGASEHAAEVLDSALEVSGQMLARIARDPRLEGLDVQRAAFIDTETTGLAGGAGTFAFLIGAGRFVDGSFRVRQFFMRDPSEEAAQLAELTAWLDGAGGLVTFNGRTFDVPLLNTRYVMNRMPAPWSDPPHLDLLPAARRIWRRRLDSCALTSLESAVFGLDREDDVPGWMVPERYRRFQFEGDARPLVGVFRHNALDILSMVSLLTRVARAWAAPEAALADAEDWLSLARAYAAEGRSGSAIDACLGALERGLGDGSREDALHLLSGLHRRREDWEPAVRIWEAMAEDPTTRRLFPFEELAKYFEHRADARDLDRARSVTAGALERLNSGALRPKRGRTRARADLEHRLARLDRRLGGSAPPEAPALGPGLD